VSAESRPRRRHGPRAFVLLVSAWGWSAAAARAAASDESEPAVSGASGLTWHGGIASIVRGRCERCHRDGGAAPFPLVTRDDVAGRAAMIRQVIATGVMPPWFATRDSGPFRDDLSLRDEERRDLLAWLQADSPAGVASGPEPARAWPSGWSIGEPDLILTLPHPIEVPATGVLDYKYIDIPFTVEDDVWVQAYEVRCDHPSICHHIEIDICQRELRILDVLDGYLPGKPPTIYPEGMARQIRKGSILRLRLHLTPNGTPVVERLRIGFRFAKEPPAWIVAGRKLNVREIRIPPGKPDYTVSRGRKLPAAAELMRVIPHMHLRGRSAKIEILFPDGRTIAPLTIERWHPDWQFAYEFAERIQVPEGTEIRCTFTYDNSAANPFNPDPERTVFYGPQIWDEMGGCFFEWARPAEEVATGAPDRRASRGR